MKNSCGGGNVVQEQSVGYVTANLLTGFGADENFVRTDASGSYSFLSDGVNSTIALTDTSANVGTQYTYDPFGNATQSGNSNTNTFEFTGRENDGTGLYYLRSRYYSPALQRFISQDPVGFNGGINLYAYAGNNPISSIDPSGTNPQQATIPPWLPLLLPLIGPELGFAAEAAEEMAATAEATEGAAATAMESGAAGGAAAEPGIPSGPTFIGQSDGPAIPVPEGATGPTPTWNRNGMQFEGGQGGNGLAPNINGVRVMNPNAQNPTGYVNYGETNPADGGWMSRNPYSGEPVDPSNPWWHIPLGPPK